jgi:hypothetical protein
MRCSERCGRPWTMPIRLPSTSESVSWWISLRSIMRLWPLRATNTLFRSAGQASTSHTEVVQGARNSLAPLLQDVGVDHGRGTIVVPESLLNGVDVGVALEQVRGEGMANGVGADGLHRTARRTATLMALVMTWGSA